MVCQERNYRIFRDEKRSMEGLFQNICATIKCRLSSLKVKKTSATKSVEKEWGVTFIYS